MDDINATIEEPPLTFIGKEKFTRVHQTSRRTHALQPRRRIYNGLRPR